MKRCVSEVIRCLKCDESMTVCDCVRHVRGVCIGLSVCVYSMRTCGEDKDEERL